MTPSIDPFREWLGLESSSAQPDHFTLLGLEEREEDQERIVAAADRALARVRGCRPGSHAAEWARLLDLLTEAKACLCDPKRRAAYRQSLKDQAMDGQPSQDGETDFEVGSLEVAPMNRSPNLYPPGMAPPDEGKDRPSAQAGTETDRSSNASARPLPDPMAPVSNRPKPSKKVHAPEPTLAKAPVANAYPPGAGPVEHSRAKTVEAGSEGADQPISLAPVAETASRVPINAHVGPPPAEPTSLVPLMACITAVLLIAMAALLYVALHDSAAPATTVPPSVPTEGSDQSSGGGLGPVINAPAASNPSSSALPSTSRPRADRLSRNAAPASPEQMNADSGTDSVASTPPVVNTDGTAPGNPEGTEDGPTGDRTAGGGNPIAGSGMESGQEAPVEQLRGALREVRAALGSHDFDKAEQALQKARGMGGTGEQRAMVARIGRLSESTKQFWQTVARQVLRFQGTEELEVGSTGLVVLVVEADDDSIVIRRSGKNTRYRVDDMPIGLAIALFHYQRNANDPELMVMRGAALSTVEPSQPNYLDEARRVWQEAAKGGAAVDDLLLTLGDVLDQ